jgi:hypothetical protein
MLIPEHGAKMIGPRAGVASARPRLHRAGITIRKSRTRIIIALFFSRRVASRIAEPDGKCSPEVSVISEKLNASIKLEKRLARKKSSVTLSQQRI